MSLQRIAVVAAVGALGVVGTLGLVTIAAAGAPAATRLSACVSSGPVGGLSAVQAQNARTIFAVATERSGERAGFLAIMVALAESSLRVLSNPNDLSGTSYPNEGVGYDHDSLGLFQQRPSWGTAAQRMSASESTHLFLDALLKVPGWEALPPWYAAQLVQRSAFTGAPSAGNGGSSVAGETYWRQAERAASIVAAIKGNAAVFDCGAASATTLAPGSVGTYGLPATYAIPQGASPAGAAAVTFALAQLGKPYGWGAEGPDSFDCSSLTQAAWRRAGVAIGRVVSQQLTYGTPTTLSALQPGDLVMIPGALGTIARPGHVGMYIGYGLIVNAPRTGDVVRVVSLTSFVSGGVAGLRHLA